MEKLIINLIFLYQKRISPLFKPSCRFYPTCSNYMIEAIKKHGPFFGALMGIFRIIRCNPFNKGGFDTVPNKFTIFRNKDD